MRFIRVATKNTKIYIEQLSLFSVVNFPNADCTSISSSTTTGTCYTSSECTSRSGSASGSCAAGFGVCCVITSSTCGSTVSNNVTYIRNPGYPSSVTPTSTGTCTTTIRKVSDDICQLRKVVGKYLTHNLFTSNNILLLSDLTLKQ